MSYISLLIALFKTWGANITGQAWLKVYLGNLLSVETWFYHASWWIWGVVVVIAIALAAISLFGGKNPGLQISASLSCMVFGCFGVILLLLPFFEWITMKLAEGMYNSVSISGDVTSGQFWVSLVIFILLGTG